MINPAVRQALVWGGSSLVAHHAAKAAEKHHAKEKERIKNMSPEERKVHKAKLEKRKGMAQAAATTLAGAGAGYLGHKLA